jgi:hypothetical protein
MRDTIININVLPLKVKQAYSELISAYNSDSSQSFVNAFRATINATYEDKRPQQIQSHQLNPEKVLEFEVTELLSLGFVTVEQVKVLLESKFLRDVGQMQNICSNELIFAFIKIIEWMLLMGYPNSSKK